MSQALLLDYLFLADRIAERIKALVPNVEVQGIDELSQATEANITTDMVYVMWEGDKFPEGEGQRSASSQAFNQMWTVMYAKREASQFNLDANQRSAGPMLASLHKAIAGWTPTDAFRPFYRINGRKPNYRANVGLYPLTFSIPLNI